MSSGGNCAGVSGANLGGELPFEREDFGACLREFKTRDGAATIALSAQLESLRDADREIAFRLSGEKTRAAIFNIERWVRS